MGRMEKASGGKGGARSYGLARRGGRRGLAATRRPGAASKVARTAQSPLSVSGRAAYLSDRTRALLMAALVACATLPYLNILFNGFVYDDDTQLVRNPYVRSFRHLKEVFTTDVWSFHGVGSVTNYYRPMMTLGYLACYKLFGMQAYGFHLVSLLLHVLVVCLVFVLTERLTGERVWAFVAAAFFALHPVHTESVAWIAAVTDLEVTFFYLLTFVFFLALARPGGGRSEVVLAAMGGTFLLALLSKEQAMTLPVLATVYEHLYRRDRSETSTAQKLARYGVLWLLAAFFFLLRIYFLGALAPRKRFPQVTPSQIVFSAMALVGQYVGKLLWPVRLCAFYVFHPSKSLFDLRVVAGLLVFFALVALFLVCWRSHDANVRFASFGILWFFVTLAPILNAHWVGLNVFAERYLYLPSVGAAWLVGLGATRLWSRAASHPVQRRALALGGLIVCGLFAARIVTRNRIWNNDVVLYSQILEFSPDAHRFLNDLGVAYWWQGDFDKAESAWRRMIAIEPTFASPLDNLGRLATRRHMYTEAAEFFRRAVKCAPSEPEPRIHLGETYLELGLKEPAEAQFRAAVVLAPHDSNALNDLANLLLVSGRLKEAEEKFRASVRAKPNVAAYNYLGMLSMRRGDVTEAGRDFRAALSLDESDSYAHFGLGDIYTLAGRKLEALNEYRAGLAEDPTNPQALAAVQKLRQQLYGGGQ